MSSIVEVQLDFKKTCFNLVRSPAIPANEIKERRSAIIQRLNRLVKKDIVES